MAPHVRPFLAVAQTTLQHPGTGARYPFHGLFTTVDLPAGAFLGFYNGVFKEGTYRGKDSYVFSTSDMYVKPKKTRGTVLGAAYPLAMANEPPRGSQANVMVVEFSRADGVVPQLPRKTRISALGFYTCRTVRAGEELFVHYGSAYYRGHYDNPHGVEDLVGAPCSIKKAQRERPVDMAAAFGLQPYVPPECFVEYES